MKTLYKLDSKGNIRKWSIWIDGSRIVMKYGVLDGEMQENDEIINFGLGKTKEAQLKSRLESRINKKIDSGYRFTIEEAQKTKGLNLLGFKKPMTAQVYGKYDVFKKDKFVFLQCKYNGFRCCITNNAGEKIAYSRNGKVINSIDHILNDLNIPEGVTVDGELYHHGTPFQTISSWIRRKQPETKNIHFVMYDVIDFEKTYSERLRIIFSINNSSLSSISLAFTDSVFSEDEIYKNVEQYMLSGYEGGMVRIPNSKYEPKRSKGLLKVKKFLDDEFEVIDIDKSKDGWGLLICRMRSGAEFRVTAPGTHDEKTECYINKDLYIGRFVNVKFLEYTDSGKPFHPVACFWRNKKEE